MDSVINNSYINSYADSFSKIICDRYFEKSELISGNEILKLTDIQQVNLLVLKNLFKNWEKESDKLKSPYFNYKSEEVKEALHNLLNTLSKNISINKNNFSPFLKAAVHDILFLIYSPYEFFKSEWVSLNNPFTLQQIQDRRKFIKINGGLFDSFIAAMENSGKKSFSHNEALSMFDEVCSQINFSPDEPKDIFEKLSNLLLLDEDQIYNDNEIDEVKKVDEKESLPIHEKYYEEKETLADKLKSENKNTLLDYHQSQKIDSLRKNISIHQKFMFLRELFDNDDAYFDRVVNYLDQTNEKEDAFTYLNTEFFDNNKWEKEDETVQEFIAVFEKKFN